MEAKLYCYKLWKIYITGTQNFIAVIHDIDWNNKLHKTNLKFILLGIIIYCIEIVKLFEMVLNNNELQEIVH
jgi:hypothetical protein